MTFAATLLSLGMLGALPDALPWLTAGMERIPWPAWRTGAGEVVDAEIKQFRWSDRALLLELPGTSEPRRVPAETLDLGSKVRLLTTDAFQQSLALNVKELEETTIYRKRMDELSRFGVIALSVYVASFIVVSWFLAMWILRSGSLLNWVQVAISFLALSFLAVTAVAWLFEVYGEDQLLEYLGIVATIHAVLFVFLVWWIYHSGFARALQWYLANWIVGLLLPFSLTMTGLSAQVYSHYKTLDIEAFDAYLSDFWLRPMGLI